MITYPLEGLHCGSCVRKLEAALQPFASQVSASLAPMQVTLAEPGADFTTLAQAVAAAGQYKLLPASPDSPGVVVSALQPAVRPSFLAVYRPLLLIPAYILGASVLVQMGLHGLQGVDAVETMRYFMAGFFLVFSFFKLLNVSAFATAYAQYDLLAARWLGWGRIANRNFKRRFPHAGTVFLVHRAVKRVLTGEGIPPRNDYASAALARISLHPPRVDASTRQRAEHALWFCRRTVGAVVMPTGQAAWLSESSRARERGGTGAGRPRCVRILTITSGSSIAAIIFN